MEPPNKGNPLRDTPAIWGSGPGATWKPRQRGRLTGCVRAACGSCRCGTAPLFHREPPVGGSNELATSFPVCVWGPCVGGIGKIIGVGLNYKDHAAESNMPIPNEPPLFLKPTSAIIGANDDVEIPLGSEKSDWEVELGVESEIPANTSASSKHSITWRASSARFDEGREHWTRSTTLGECFNSLLLRRGLTSAVTGIRPPGSCHPETRI